MNKTFHTILAAFLAVCAAQAQQAPTRRDDGALFEAVVAADLRLERIGYGLASRSVSICPDHSAATGIVVRSLLEFAPNYRSTARAALSFGAPVVVEAIVPESPAAIAGLRSGDGILNVDGHIFPERFPEVDAPPALSDLESAQSLLEALPTDRPVPIEILRGTSHLRLQLRATPACKSRFALSLSDRSASEADGTYVRIGAKLLEKLSDGGLAVVVAHELSHNILNHAATLDRLHVKQGIAGEFGRSARETLRLEDEADRLSVSLLARAGYDPLSVAMFWRGEGRALIGSLPRGPSHRGWNSRAALAAAEAERVQPNP